MRYVKWVYIGFVCAALFGFWLMLSGRYKTTYLVIGALSVVVVLFLNRDIFRFQPGSEREGAGRALLFAWWRWLSYVTWLLYGIVIANFQVAYLVLHPRMPIDPILMRFKVAWPEAAAQVILANSITLTPGTVTVDLSDSQYTVHTLLPSLAQPLVSGNLQRRVAALFIEKAEETPVITWIRSVASLDS